MHGRILKSRILACGGMLVLEVTRRNRKPANLAAFPFVEPD